MKKIISLIAIVSLILVGCSSKPNENSLEGMTLNKVGGKLDTEEMELVTPNNKTLYKDPEDDNRTFFILEDSNSILSIRYDFGRNSTISLEKDKNKIDEIVRNALPKDATFIEKKSDFMEFYESKTTGRLYWVSIQYNLKNNIDSISIIADEINSELKLTPNTEREKELEESLKNRVGTKLEKDDLNQLSTNTFTKGTLTYEVDSEKNIKKIIIDTTLKGVAFSDKKIDGLMLTENILDYLLPKDANMIDKKGENTYIYESKKTGMKYKLDWKVTPDNKVESIEVVEHKE